MQVTETLSDGLRRGFAITVPMAAIEDKRTAKLNEISKTVKLPGFRPGKVPASIVRQRYGSAVMARCWRRACRARCSRFWRSVAYVPPASRRLT